jgi:Baseplate J-like protein
MTDEAPRLDTRNADAVVSELLERAPAYVPAWLPSAPGAAWTLLQVVARYAEALIERLNEAPAKNKLAFLDLLGINLLPAQAARAPLVFLSVPNVGDSRVPARSRVGANVPGSTEPIVFETEQAIALTAARLAELVTLWPARDAYADHSAAIARGEPFTLFEPLKPVPHEIYLAHDTLLAFGAGATIQVEFDLGTAGSEPVSMVWEYWDGQIWQPFKPFGNAASDSRDATDGLTRSGVITLHAACGKSQKTVVNRVEAYWIRARLDKPLPPNPARVLATVDRIRVRSVMERPAFDWAITHEMTPGALSPIYGSVKHDDGSPIPKVDVQFDPEEQGQEVSTDADGNYKFSSLPDNPDDFELDLEGSEIPTAVDAVEVAALPVKVDFLLTLGPKPDMAIGDGLQLDLSKTFEPFGKQPHPGSVFYFSSEEVFPKSGAEMTVWIKFATPDQPAGTENLPKVQEVVWEYWNGYRWVVLAIHTTQSEVPTLSHGGDGDFTLFVPSDIARVEVNGQKALWMRARLLKGAYGFKRTFTFPDNLTIEIIETVGPLIADMRLGYIYRSRWERPERCFTHSDFQFEDRSQEIRWPGAPFPAFRPVADVTPTVYFGFDRPLPADLLGLYADVRESVDQSDGPPLQWEYWDNETWRSLSVEDETHNLALPGMLEALWPGVPPLPSAGVTQAGGIKVVLSNPREAARFTAGDLLQIVTVTGDGELTTLDSIARDSLILRTALSREYTAATIRVASLPRFGTPRTWFRARLKGDGAPLESAVNGVYANAVWGEQLQSFENEVIGSSDHEPGQVFFVRHRPVLEGAAVEVRELEGARAAVELPILRDELKRQGMSDADVRTVIDRRSGAISEVWVRWRERPHLFFSTPDDRDYVIERSRGRILFGDDRNARVPPAGPDNVRIAAYRSGGGLTGNVSAGAVSQLLSGVVAQGVTNPRAAEGGADVETLSAVNDRGPQVIRHRGRSLSAQDYEALALEASPAVAVARALPATHPNGRPAPGWVTVIIVPHAIEAEPQPSYGLRTKVREFLALRAPAGIGAHIAVIGPTYLPIGIETVLAPASRSEAGLVVERAHRALAAFLHPLTGGPDGDGWRFGRDVYLSDVASVLEALEAVDYVPTINLLLNGTPRGERVKVPRNRIVVAGPLLISLSKSES